MEKIVLVHLTLLGKLESPWHRFSSPAVLEIHLGMYQSAEEEATGIGGAARILEPLRCARSVVLCVTMVSVG